VERPTAWVLKRHGLFAREGAKVVIADVLEEEGTRLASEITAAGGAALFVRPM